MAVTDGSKFVHDGVVRDASRAKVVSRDVIVGLVILAVAALLGLSRCASQRPAATSSPAPSTTPSVVAVPSQPDLHGYSYLISRERYVVRPSDNDPLEVQTRLRESWSATTDGWTWARQTGDEPAHFIFAPDTHWQAIRQGPSESTAIARTLRSQIRASDQAAGVSPATPAELDDRLFDFIYSEMAIAYLPAGAIPGDYRRALVDVLSGLDGSTRTAAVRDPEGRASIRISYVNQQARPGMSRSLFFDTGNQFLAYTYTVDGGTQTGVHTITERRIIAKVPDEVLAILGSHRVEQAIWK